MTRHDLFITVIIENIIGGDGGVCEGGSKGASLSSSAGGCPSKVGLGDERGLRPLWKPGGQRWPGQHVHRVQHQGCQPQDPEGVGCTHR